MYTHWEKEKGALAPSGRLLPDVVFMCEEFDPTNETPLPSCPVVTVAAVLLRLLASFVESKPFRVTPSPK